MKDITSQQNKVLDCIQIHLKKTGFPPTRADICREMGFKSPNSAETHLRALEKKGFIAIESGTSRGISILNPELEQEENEYPIIGLVAAGSPTLANKKKKKVFKDAGIMEDDLIAVKKTQDIRNGDIVIARIDDEVTVKYFHRHSPSVVHLQPANNDFNDIKVDLEETELFIEGKSVGLIREN